jgi:hypothetical protein
MCSSSQFLVSIYFFSKRLLSTYLDCISELFAKWDVSALLQFQTSLVFINEVKVWLRIYTMMSLVLTFFFINNMVRYSFFRNHIILSSNEIMLGEDYLLLFSNLKCAALAPLDATGWLHACCWFKSIICHSLHGLTTDNGLSKGWHLITSYSSAYINTWKRLFRCHQQSIFFPYLLTPL